MIRLGAVLSYAGSWSDTLTTSWSSADPKNLRVISGKDIFRDSVQYQSWYVYWSAHQDIKKPDIILRVVEYSATKVALEMDGRPLTGSVIILETGRQ